MRVKQLPFLPTSYNFSTLSEGTENTFYDDTLDDQREIEIDKELMLLKYLSNLTSDKERTVLLLEVLREYGYQLDYNSIAKSLGVKLRWFMRIKKNVRTKVQEITTNAT